MVIEWTVNGASLESKGLTLVGGGFRTQGTSFCLFDAALDIDAAQAFANEESVTLSRVQDGVSVPFFRGKIATITKAARPEYEGHAYALEDAWAQLETTIYMEPWLIGDGSYLAPRFVLGMIPDGDEFKRCTVGEQIEAAINFAAGEAGVDISMGSCPAGEILWPEEMRGVSVAEIIRIALKFHPDWIPWIDHSASPPTFNVTPISGMSAITLPVSGGEVQGLSVVKRDDMIPVGVRIFYEFATIIDNEVFRNGVIDKYPGGAPDASPKMINATIELAGMQMQTQKSPVQVRAIPTSKDDVNVKAWLKEKFPHLVDIPDAAFKVKTFDRELVAESAEHPDPINPRAERLSITDVDDLPNELIRGQINDWMRVRVGKIGIKIEIEKQGVWTAATEAQVKAFGKGVLNIASMTATNAETKVYKGLSQWAAPEEVPAGIAQAVYNSFIAACKYEGSAKVTSQELPATRYYAKKVNVTGGDAGWATMNAPVHSVDWDLGTGQSTIGFGPVPELAPQDFLELQRMIRQRGTKWWSTDERGSKKIGGDGVPSAAGDTIVGYDLPETIFEPGEGDSGHSPFSLRDLRVDGASYTVQVWPGWIREIVTSGAEGSDGSILHPPKKDGAELSATPPPEFTMAFEDFLYVTYATDKAGNVKADPLPGFLVSAAEEKSIHYQPVDGDGAGGSDGDYKIRIGRISGTEEEPVWLPFQNSDIEHYHDLFTGKNIGEGAGSYKGRNAADDVYEWRSTKGNFGLLFEVAGDGIQADFLAENIGGGNESLKVEEGDLPAGAAQFRTHRGLTSAEATAEGITPQLQVSTADGEGSEEGANDTILYRGNGVKGSLTINMEGEEVEGSPGDPVELAKIQWEDGFNTTAGDIIALIPRLLPGAGNHLNVHVRTQEEGTDGNEWVAENLSVETLCWRNGDYVGHFSQYDPDSLTEIFVGYEEAAPAGLFSITVSNINPVA
jgi:hypothetical protein